MRKVVLISNNVSHFIVLPEGKKKKRNNCKCGDIWKYNNYEFTKIKMTISVRSVTYSTK